LLALCVLALCSLVMLRISQAACAGFEEVHACEEHLQWNRAKVSNEQFRNMGWRSKREALREDAGNEENSQKKRKKKW
jgi:hypothetical protein